jgi:hypothetical protein
MRREGGIDERFAAYVRERGNHHLRLPVSVSPPPASQTWTPPAG